jgi:predicted nuclease with TOPRIM domain
LINYIEELKKEYKSVTSKYEEGNTKIKLLHKEVEQLKEAQLHVTRQSSSKKHNEQ